MHLEECLLDLFWKVWLEERVVHTWCDNPIHFIKYYVHLSGVCSSEKPLEIPFSHFLFFSIRCTPSPLLIHKTINIIFTTALTSSLMKELGVLVGSRQPNQSRTLSPSYFFLVQESVDIIPHFLY